MNKAYPEFLKVFEDLPDPRHHRTRRHRLVDILFIALCSTLTGGKSFVDMEDLATVWEGWFKQFIPMTGGPPSHDTFNRVFQMIDPQYFEVCFRAWTEQMRQSLGTEIIAVDGKVNRGSGSREQAPITLVNAWASKNRLLLGQLATAENSNEISAVPELLKGLMLKKSIVTVDAMHCQKETAAAVVKGGGNYVFALKGNQGRLHEEARLFLDEMASEVPAEVEKIEKGHGRFEIRRYWQTDEIGWFADLKQWPGLKSFGMVHSIREMNDGKKTEERRYYISSLPKGTDLFAESVRAHWGIENKVHWCLDVIFGEDQNRARTKYASTNLSTLRKMALNIARKEPGKKGLARKMRHAIADPLFLITLLGLDA
jgi:predicted transposase YbfD/YdcC